MSVIEYGLFNKLINDTGVSAIISSRLYPQYNFQFAKTYPLAIYKTENVVAQLASGGPTGFESADYIIAAIDSTPTGAATLAKAIQLALNGQSGTWAGVKVQGVFLKDDGVSDDVVTDPTTEAILYYVKEIQFECKYNND